MCINKEKNNFCCCIYSILAGLVAGIGIGAIYYGGVIASITTLIYVTLALAIIEVIGLLFRIFCRKHCSSKCINNSCIIPIVIGSLITSIFGLLATALPAFSITVALLVGAITFFLVSNLIAIISSIIEKLCDDKCPGYND